MSWKSVWVAVQALSLAGSVSGAGTRARADEPTAPPAPPAGASREAQKKPAKRPAAPKKPVSRVIRRDTEGTEAHDRFSAEISIPSHYQVDGKPLEVDPD